MLSGLFIAISPLIPIAYQNMYALFVGVDYNLGHRDMVLLFTFPLGIFFSMCGIILEVVISKMSSSYKDSSSNRFAVFLWALFFASFPIFYVFS